MKLILNLLSLPRHIYEQTYSLGEKMAETLNSSFCLLCQRVGRGPLLRRHGFQECILLVTQRITKYPVLFQRIYENTKGETKRKSLKCQYNVFTQNDASNAKDVGSNPKNTEKCTAHRFG